VFYILFILYLKCIYLYGEYKFLCGIKLAFVFDKETKICSIMASWDTGATKSRDPVLDGTGRDPIPGFSIWHFWIPGFDDKSIHTVKQKHFLFVVYATLLVNLKKR